MYKIEKGVPIPNGGKYPLTDMGVGDSILVSKEDLMGLRAAIQKAQRTVKMRWMTRAEGENCVRVWRTV
jgi:hypothetical protein